jgi:hypothetical protein
VLPTPAITSIFPKAALPNTKVTNFQVAGLNLTGSTFTFVPAFNPAAIMIDSVSIDPPGTSAKLSLTINANAAGAFTGVATNASGSSSAFPSAANAFSVVANPEADSDGDGYPDGLEVEFGSDPLDPKSTPDFYSKGEAISLTFSLLNNAAPAPPQPDLREATSQLFSILNTVSLSSLTTDDSGKRSAQSATSDSSNTLGAPVSGDSPARIVHPRESTKLMEGQTLRVQAGISKSERPAQVDFLVNGVLFAADSTDPYELTFTVPAGVSNLVFASAARNSAGDLIASDEVTVSVEKDARTSVTGRALNASGDPVDGATVELALQGLKAEFFELPEPLTSIPDLLGRKPNRVEVVSAVNFRNPQEVFGNDPFGVGMTPDYAARFSGYIKIDSPGRYQFILGADEGARLVLNGVTVLDAPSGNGLFREQGAAINLSPGLIPIELTYYESIGNAELQLPTFRQGANRRLSYLNRL